MYKALALILALLAFALPCASEEPDVDREFRNMMEEIPDDVANLLPESFFDGIDGAAKGLGEITDMPFWHRLLGDIFSDSLKEIFPILLSLFAVLLASALLGVFRDTLRSNALSGAVGLAVSVVMISMFVRLASAHVELAFGYVERLSRFCVAMLPIMGTILAMGGSGGAAVATHGGILMLLGVIEAVVGEAFGGIVGISLAFSAANVFSGRFKLGAVARAVRRCFGIFFGVVTSLMGFLLSLKIGIASATDSVAMRGAKIFASNAIPIVGSSIGDSFKTLSTALSYMKTVSGSVGVILILLLALPVFISVWLYRSGLVLLSGAAEMLGCDRERELISGIVSVYGYILAVVSVVTVVFIFMLTLFTKSTLAFGGGI